MNSSGMILASLLLTTATALPQHRSRDPLTTSLEWRQCLDVRAEVAAALPMATLLPFDCASLTVPLDYTDSASSQLDLALFKINATKEPVLGSVLWNPGGPGGSGADNLAASGQGLIDTLGGQYDVISWDPRGTGKTIPFDCKLSEASSKRRDVAALIHTNLTHQFLNGGWDSAESVAQQCYDAMNATGEFIGTAFVARDMLRIIDAIDGDGQLRYWGLSYGSILGSTFAAMFPDRIDRMLLDAVVNPHDYQAGHWGNCLVDADKTMLAFLEECAKNQDKCALSRYTGLTTAIDMLKVINAGLEPFRQNAAAGPTSLATYSSIKAVIYEKLYFPKLWPELAEVIVGFLNGSSSATTRLTKRSVTSYSLGVDALDGIRCSDALWQATAPEQILDQVEYQATVSDGFSDIGYVFTWTCAAWKMKAKEQYKGNFTAKTSFPILLVNGDFDVATPLVSAFNASAGFEDSVVLTHMGYGRGLTADPSQCTNNAVQAYFMHGTLPMPGTRCEPDVGAWDLSTA